MKKLVIAAALVIFGAQTVAFAQQEVDNRVQNQENRIQNGENNGSLSPVQAQRLKNRDEAIKNRAALDAAANGGKLTPGESRRLNRRLNRVSRRIHRRKTDD